MLFSFIIVPLIGFYDGFFGPGAGTFYLLAMTSLLGTSMLKGMAYARVLNLVSHLSLFFLLIYLGKMAWLVGIIMALGESVGVYLGSHYAYQYGTKLIKPLVVIVCMVMAIKLMV